MDEAVDPAEAAAAPAAAADAQALRRLLDVRPTAALATLHRGEPAVSMVPFVLHAGGLVIHVSALATHTGDLRAHPRAALLVTAADDAAVPPQALPRVALDVEAEELPAGGPAAAAARAAYLARFPEAAITFELADFTLFTLRPRHARLVAGFGRARSLTGERLAAWLAA